MANPVLHMNHSHVIHSYLCPDVKPATSLEATTSASAISQTPLPLTPTTMMATKKPAPSTTTSTIIPTVASVTAIGAPTRQQ